MDLIKTKWSFLEPLIFGREFVHLEEISRRLGRRHSVVRKHLNEFVEAGILNRKKIGRMIMYKLDSDFPFFLDVIVLVEKEMSLDIGNLALREVVFDLRESLKLEDIGLIFGSAVGDIEKAGDVDFLMIGRLDGEGKKNVKKLERKINKSIHLVEVDGFEDISDALREEIRKKHLIVQGSENIVKWLV